jgi:nucleoid DNA-binding protein
MNKTQLAHAIALKSGFNHFDAQAMISALQEVIKECFEKNENITLKGTGTFKATVKKERNGVNPSNSKPMRIPARKLLIFVAAKNLKQVMELSGK